MSCEGVSANVAVGVGVNVNVYVGVGVLVGVGVRVGVLVGVGVGCATMETLTSSIYHSIAPCD